MEVLRETEIRPDDLMAGQAARYEADVRWLNDRRDSFVSVACPVCDASEADPTWVKAGMTYVTCRSCETVYTNPRPDSALLTEFYRSSENYEYWNRVIFPASEGARRSKIFRPRAQRTVQIAHSHGKRGGRLLDVGAGFGTFCEEVLKLEAFDRVIAVEPEPHLAETCRQKGLEVIEAPIEDVDLEGMQVDVVTNFEVIEHLFSPTAFVRRCAEIIQPGGLFVVTCPNVRGFDFTVLGSGATGVDIEHLNYMHPDSLAGLLQRTGFEVVERLTPGRLDAELVRKKALQGDLDLTDQPFLRRVLIDDWGRCGDAFQAFLADNELSSNMWLVGRRGSTTG